MGHVPILSIARHEAHMVPDALCHVKLFAVAKQIFVTRAGPAYSYTVLTCVTKHALSAPRTAMAVRPVLLAALNAYST